MVSRIGYVQTRRDVVVVFILVVVGGLIMQSSADDTEVPSKRQLENDWASTSKKDHKGPNTYAFTYDVENAPTNNIQYRMEERLANGSVVGSYGQVQPDGKIRVVSYIADKDGVKTHVKDNGDGGVDQYVAAGSNVDPVQRVTSQIIQTAVKSQQQQQQQQHKSPLHDKYFRPTPSTAAAAGQKVDSAHSYHQQRTNVDPAAFRPEDSPGFRETNQPFVGDQLKDKLQSSLVEYQVTPTQQPHQLQQQQQQQQQLQPQQQLQQQQPFPLHVAAQAAGPLPPVAPYSLQPQPTQPTTHYMLNVPPLPSLGDNSPLPLLPGQAPLPITPDRGPIMIPLHQQQQQYPQPQQQQFQYQPTQVHPQHLRPPQQHFQPGQMQSYQQQPVRVQPPVHLQQLQQHHQQQLQARLAPHQQQQQHQLQLQQQLQQQQQLKHQQQMQQQLQQQQRQQQQQQQRQQQQQQQQPQQQQPNVPYQSVMQQQYPQQVNVPAATHPSQIQIRGNVQQHQAVSPLQFFHQPNPATTMEQYRQQLQLQAAESHIFPVFVLPPINSVLGFKGKNFRL